jgi:hypothetical protein
MALYTNEQIEHAGWYVRSYRNAIAKARQGIGIEMHPGDTPLNEAGLRKEFITALFARIDTKAEIRHTGRKWSSIYQTEQMRDCRLIRDHAQWRRAVHQIMTPELRRRFAHILTSWDN